MCSSGVVEVLGFMLYSPRMVFLVAKLCFILVITFLHLSLALCLQFGLSYFFFD